MDKCSRDTSLNAALNRTWTLNGRRDSHSQIDRDHCAPVEPPATPRSLRIVRVSDESARELQQILSQMPGGPAVTLDEAREAGQRLVSFTFLVRDLKLEITNDKVRQSNPY